MQSLSLDKNVSENLLNFLCKFNTPTICNAIEVAEGKRGFNNFTRETMCCSSVDEAPIVGFALTAKISAKNPADESLEATKKRRMDYYKYISTATKASVAVIEDTDFPGCVGAYWGELNANIHKNFEIVGAITNGLIRDLGDLPSGFPVVAKSIGPSHGFVHVKEIDIPVNICGMTVKPGNLIHADCHGGIVIPHHVIGKIEDSVHQLLKSEKLILDETKSKKLNFEEFSAIWEKFENSRT